MKICVTNNSLCKKNNLLKVFMMLLLIGMFVSFSGQWTSLFSYQMEDNGEITDEEIEYAIETEFLMDDRIPQDKIDVNVEDGVVTLSGWVNNILIKECCATEVANSVKGVRAVINNIKIDPIYREDREIRKDVNDAMLSSAMRDYEIDVSVEDAIVTIRGEVDSWHEKQLSEKIVKGVKGVKGVRNLITIKEKKGYSDREIKAEIEHHLEFDPNVDEKLLDVNVDNGNVKLSGIVGSVDQKSQVITDSWVAGAKSVQAEELEVDWEAYEEQHRAREFIEKSDDEIKEAIQDVFLYDPRISRTPQPKVTVNDGVVILSGKVNNVEEKRAAVEDAKNTTGVWRVKDQMKVRPQKFVIDPKLEKRIENAIRRDPNLDIDNIQVSVRNRIAFLHGAVETEVDKSHAELVASRIRNLAGVENELIVKSKWKQKSDIEIKQDIKKQLYWNPIIEGDNVEVKVDDGVATLTGTVDFWTERELARKEALQAGAKKVKNHLKSRQGPEYYKPAKKQSK